VSAKRHDAATPVGLVSLWGCVRRRVRRARGRAGGQWVRCARGSMQTRRRTALCYVLCCRASRIRSLATSRGAVGTLLGFRHTARRMLRRAVCGGVGSRGSLEPGAMEQRALRVPCCRLHCSSVGNVWWWGVAMAVGSAPERCDGGDSLQLHPLRHARRARPLWRRRARRACPTRLWGP
jgi:hypothetical protein